MGKLILSGISILVTVIINNLAPDFEFLTIMSAIIFNINLWLRI